MTDSTQKIYELVETLFEETPFRRIRIHRVGLTVAKIEWKNRQFELFEEGSRQKELESAMDAIRQRFGFMSVMPASLMNLQNHYRMDKSGYILHAPALTQ